MNFFEYVASIALFVLAYNEVQHLVYSLLKHGFSREAMARYSAHSLVCLDIVRQRVFGNCVPLRSASLVYCALVMALVIERGVISGPLSILGAGIAAAMCFDVGVRAGLSFVDEELRIDIGRAQYLREVVYA